LYLLTQRQARLAGKGEKMNILEKLEDLKNDIWSPDDRKAIEKASTMILNRDKIIRYLQEENIKRGKEIVLLKKKWAKVLPRTQTMIELSIKD
jgi:hypothetical protein